MMRGRTADEFAAIRARMEELRRDRVRLLGMNDEDGRRRWPCPAARTLRDSVRFRPANKIGTRSRSPVLSLLQACLEAGTDDRGDRCPDCRVQHLCASEARWQVRLATSSCTGG